MSHDDQLAWEARAGKPAAIAAFAAGLLLFAGYLYLPVALGGVSTEADDALRDAAREGTHFIVRSVIVAIGSLFVIPVFAYLYRAIRHRRPEFQSTALILAILGAVTAAVISVWQAIEITKVADDFFPFSPAEDAARLTDPDDYLEAVSPEAAAEKASREALSPVARGLADAGTIAFAFAFVMFSVNSMRVGLLSRFMGVIGIIVGVLFVIPLGIQVLHLFWFGALGMLFLGRWPGAGRGPAWETGEPIPWPSAADRAAPPDEEGPEQLPEPEAAPARPVSRKRKKKRR